MKKSVTILFVIAVLHGVMSIYVNIPPVSRETFETIQCDPGQSVCADLSQCIPSTFFCDGRVDCEDGSDEKRTLCFYRNFTCADNHEHGSIRAHLRCNGKKDCLDGSDEEGCKRRVNGKLTNIIMSKSRTKPTTSSFHTNTASEKEDKEVSQTTELVNFTVDASELNVQANYASEAEAIEKAEELLMPTFLTSFILWVAIAIGLLTFFVLSTFIVAYVIIYLKKRPVMPNIKA